MTSFPLLEAIEVAFATLFLDTVCLRCSLDDSTFAVDKEDDVDDQIFPRLGIPWWWWSSFTLNTVRYPLSFAPRSDMYEALRSHFLCVCCVYFECARRKSDRVVDACVCRTIVFFPLRMCQDISLF